MVGKGTPESCTEAALDHALAEGGMVTFDCGIGPATITVTSTKIIAQDTPIDGGSLVTISGGNRVGVFSVNAGVKFTVQNLIIANGNRADYDGGGIANFGTLTVTNSTFFGNRAGNGGGVVNIGTLTVSNSIVANSTNGGDCVYTGIGTLIDSRHNLIENATNSCGLTNGVNGNLVGIDPKLDPAGLKDNGGPTQTIALLSGSPAINAGDEAVCAAAPVNGIDQRGYVRPGTGYANCSIGAYEDNSPGPPAGVQSTNGARRRGCVPQPSNRAPPFSQPFPNDAATRCNDVQRGTVRAREIVADRCTRPH